MWCCRVRWPIPHRTGRRQRRTGGSCSGCDTEFAKLLAMRVLVIGGTRFLGRRIVERLHERGDEVLVVHRGRCTPKPWVPVEHLVCDRRDLASRAGEVRAFGPEAVVDSCALTGADVDAVLPLLTGPPAVVLSSQDVYEAHAGLRSGSEVAAMPLDEDAEVRRERYPYRGLGLAGVPTTTRSSTSRSAGSHTAPLSCACR